MGALVFILLIVVGLPWLGCNIGKSIGGYLDNSFSGGKYIDSSVNNHYHTHQNITVIDDEYHRKGVEYHNKKEKKNLKKNLIINRKAVNRRLYFLV
ncbi:hypothetical protein JJC03_09145 [Flavobacterium oreochromis]|uniref:hypothetical protein n=1 Tax=Flavobacterium oreochromis TaxID=2906078 RepID=UPI001CE6D624|nr:hypothetical protein [Flavobacterium oreochromis]QYS85404.1 hypothetical protein JJC03_09145 [Flavobacterium oreochromis]